MYADKKKTWKTYNELWILADMKINIKKNINNEKVKNKKNSKRNFNIIVYINKHFFFKLSFKKNIKIK